MSVLRYVSHPEVVIDPDVPVPEWGLTETGRQRVETMCTQPWIAGVGCIISSGETKALEAAWIIARVTGLDIDMRPGTGETDRSSTGYVPIAEHDALSVQFFGQPRISAQGWERAIDVQSRVARELADVLEPDVDETDGRIDRDVLIVGHGGAGTLLYCQLAGEDIHAWQDQPSPGHYWAYDLATRRMLHPWRAIDDIE